MRINAENLLDIETKVGKEVGGIRWLDAFIGIENGHVFIQIDFKDKHYRESITDESANNINKEVFIDRFAHYAAKYFLE